MALDVLSITPWKMMMVEFIFVASCYDREPHGGMKTSLLLLNTSSRSGQRTLTIYLHKDDDVSGRLPEF